jgi:hypothetical protein
MKISGVVVVIAFVFTLSSCATMMFVGSKQSKFGSTVELIEKGAYATIEYKSHKQLLVELNSKAKNEMWSADKLNKKEHEVSPGGHVIVSVSGPTIGSANTKYWMYVVQTMDGQEILRKSGVDDIPDFTYSKYGTTWWNIDVISIDKPMNSPFKVFVIDSLSEKRSGFIVYPDK